MSADCNDYLSKVYLEIPADCSLSSQEMMSTDVRISQALLKVSTDDDVHADITVILITKNVERAPRHAPGSHQQVFNRFGTPGNSHA